MYINLNSLGETIKKYRSTKKYSTQELANKLGVSVGFISHLENGKNDAFKLDLFIKLLLELDIPLSEIIPNKALNLFEVNLNSKNNQIQITFNSDETKDINLIKGELEKIIIAYINSILLYDYNPHIVKAISKHIIEEINYSKNFKNLI